ncbi:hypothetical protein B0I35DRAFT_431414 [Stachybotrys elegans]|uniref:Uncharacterized protein n=1 Tax=Stachybotrys elegans TaxID=80388 RepID=A0A8K0WQA0_9HYPO|nr:hypothetical protein B0I35DRAFT_431414 [Stachybotrys elegans]
MASSPAGEGPGSSRRINRTRFSPWTKAVLSKPPSSSAAAASSQNSSVASPSTTARKTESPASAPTPAPADPDPEPSRVVSDIVLPSTEPQPQPQPPPPQVSSERPLSGFAKIVAAQKEWETQQQHQQKQQPKVSRADSTSSEDSSSSADLPAVTPGMKRQPAPPASINPYIPVVPSMPVATPQKRTSEDLPSLHPDPKRARPPPSSQPATAIERAAARVAAVEQAKLASNFDLRVSTMIPPTHSPAPSPVNAPRKPLTPAELVARSREEARRSVSLPVSASASPVQPSIHPQARVDPQPKNVPPAAQNLPPIERRADGHVYGTFIGPNGPVIRNGVIIPTNYKAIISSEFPFPCPVEGCPHTSFRLLDQLATHFSGAHHSTQMYDKCDGTLSVVGTYRNPSGPSPAIVVGRAAQPLPLPAYVPPSRQGSHAMPTPIPPASTPVPTPPPRIETPVPVPTMPGQRNPELVNCLEGILSKSFVVPRREDIEAMLCLRKLRGLPKEFIAFYYGKSNDTVEPSMYACAVAYMTGEEVTGPNRCTLRYETSRLSEKCIALPSSLSTSAQKVFYKDGRTCVGCRYWSLLQRRKVRCQWSTDSSDSTDTDIEPVARPKADITRRTSLSRNSSARRNYGVVDMSQDEQAASAITAEHWEFVPGKRESQKDGEVIALARSYLDNAQPFKVAEDISTHIITIKMGSRHHFPADSNVLRICHIMSGKADVIMDGEDHFSLGPGGMVKINLGTGCVMENRLYMDIKVVVTAIDR